MTALTGVIVPAIQAAVQRRAYNLTLLHKKSLTTTTPQHANDISIIEQRRRQVYAQENIRKLAGKVARLFGELEQWDTYAPVPMAEGGGGDGAAAGTDSGDNQAIGLLEGFLEEVIVRIEPEDVV